jgi:hypothetical protein
VRNGNPLKLVLPPVNKIEMARKLDVIVAALPNPAQGQGLLCRSGSELMRTAALRVHVGGREVTSVRYWQGPAPGLA